MRKNAGDKKSVEHTPSFSRHKWCHKTNNNRSPNLRISSDRYFQFHWICKQQWVEVRNSVPNWEVYFPFRSSLKLHILHALLWKLLLYDLIQCMYRLQQKHTVLDFFGHNVMQASCIFFTNLEICPFVLWILGFDFPLVNSLYKGIEKFKSLIIINTANF